MNASPTQFDAVIVGYGPTGMTLASLLGQLGHRVAVVERWPQLYGLPRLTHIDGETARLISLAGDGDHALREAWTTPHYNWLNGKGKLLMDVAQGNTRRMIWDDHLSVHQPHIEDAIHERILSLPNVVLFRGYEALELQQSDGRASLTIQPWTKRQASGHGATPSAVDRTTLQARYLIGADGSNSFVRGAVGVDRQDFGFNERWLCVDTMPKRPLPARFNEDAVQVCDPKRGYMFMPIGRRRQRFEFALLPHETTEAMSQPEAAWGLLEKYHGLGAEDLNVMRHLVYTFECRLARRWREGNVFLAGDACHTNPPYLGQGACSGMRDANNLAWKLDLVLRGLAGEALLDSYETERLPHVRTLMRQARSLGLVANTSNPVKAAVRDLVFRLKLAPKPEFPVLCDGVLQRSADGKLGQLAGSLPDQGHLLVDGRRMRLDELTGYGFTLLMRGAAAATLLPTTRQTLEPHGVKLLEMETATPAALFTQVLDVDGVYRRLLDGLGADAVLLRPDFVLFGHSPAARVQALVEGFLTHLRQREPASDAMAV